MTYESDTSNHKVIRKKKVILNNTGNVKQDSNMNDVKSWKPWSNVKLDDNVKP